jgi:phage terminase large subunit-like protein
MPRKTNASDSSARARPRARKRSSLRGEWRDLLFLSPGYDPFAQAADCWFDHDLADHAVAFYPECLVHVEGALAGQPFALEPWQKCFVGNLAGWVRKDAQGRVVRRYREGFLEVPRKNGKTPLVAGLGLAVLFCDPEAGQQDYIAASDKEQAGHLFRHCKGMVERCEPMAKRCRIFGGNAQAGQGKSIFRESDGSFLRVISSDANTKHGGNSHLVLVDELHAQTSRDLVDVLQTSMASSNRRQPLFISVTTAGHNRLSICYEKYQYACRVRDNPGDPARPGYDPAFFPMIFEAKPDEDWRAEETWANANPNLHVSVSVDYLRRECQRAVETPAYENTFRQLHLNQWTEQASRWLSMQAWDGCGLTPIDLDALRGRTCFAGLDLASTRDLTAFVLLFPDGDGGCTLVPHFWIPSEGGARRGQADGVPYPLWIKQGHLNGTAGDWCDYTQVVADILALADQYSISQIAFDPHEASMVAQHLMDNGLNLLKFTQTFKNYNEPVKLFEQLVNEQKIQHGGHPVLRWNADNVALDHNIQGLRIPSKKKSGEKIDGIVAALMATGSWILSSQFDTGSWYYKGALLD